MLHNTTDTTEREREGLPPTRAVAADRWVPVHPRKPPGGDFRWRAFDELIGSLGAGGAPEHSDALRALHELVAHFARTGELGDVERAIARLELLASRARSPAVDELIDHMSGSDEVVGVLIDRLEDGAKGMDVPSLCRFLEKLRVYALRPLLRRSARTTALDAPLRACASTIIAGDPDGFARFVEEERDPDLLCTGLGIVGEQRVRAAEEAVLRLQRHPRPRVRRAAVGTSLVLRNEALLRGVTERLEDPDPDVRMEAARGLGALRYRPAARRLAAIATSPRLRRADLAEKRVFFDACGRMAGREAIEALDRILNGRRLLLLREPAETRASAASALGRARTPAARRALFQARDTPEPSVRTAVRQALARMMRARTP